MHASVVVALGSEETLPGILSHIHQAGFGANALVIRPRRTSIQRQLERHGIPTARMPERVDEADAALLIHAAGRVTSAANLTRQGGASATWIVGPNGAWDLVDDDVIASAPQTVAGSTIIPAAATTTVPDEPAGI